MKYFLTHRWFLGVNALQGNKAKKGGCHNSCSLNNCKFVIDCNALKFFEFYLDTPMVLRRYYRLTGYQTRLAHHVVCLDCPSNHDCGACRGPGQEPLGPRPCRPAGAVAPWKRPLERTTAAHGGRAFTATALRDSVTAPQPGRPIRAGCHSSVADRLGGKRQTRRECIHGA